MRVGACPTVDRVECSQEDPPEHALIATVPWRSIRVDTFVLTRTARAEVIPTAEQESVVSAPALARGPEAAQEITRVDLERLGETQDVHETHISLAALDGAHIGPVKSGALCEFFLRPAHGMAMFSDAAAELSERRRGRAAAWHVGI